MKKNIFFLILILSGTLYAQNKISKGKVDYNMIISNENGIANYKSTLYFNETNSRFIYSLKKNTSAKDAVISHDRDSISIKIESRDTTAISICVDKVNKKTYTIYEKNTKQVLYEDFFSQNWTLSAEQKQIGKFTCYKATTHFRGRDYTGYYTTEIPISVGPFKFSGLPGLLLELYDTNKEVYFEATHIVIPFTSNFDISFDAVSLISRDENKKRMSAIMEKLNKEFEQMNRKTESRSGRDGNTITSKSTISKSREIELD